MQVEGTLSRVEQQPTSDEQQVRKPRGPSERCGVEHRVEDGLFQAVLRLAAVHDPTI